MFHNITMLLSCCCLLTCMSGCKNNDEVELEIDTSMTAVVVGMGNSRFAGSCPGATYDADRMYSLLKSKSNSVVIMKNEKATKKRVMNEIQKGISKAGNGLFVFYYSGHGGSQPFADTGLEETDGSDEFFCFYDTYMRDNDMWKLINTSKGRVFLIVDACHSQTIFRMPSICMKEMVRLSNHKRNASSFSMLCWSGCPDNTFSYGASDGGKFTNTLLKYYNRNKSETYESLWKKIKSDSSLLSYEDPQQTIIGSGFNGVHVFQ